MDGNYKKAQKLTIEEARELLRADMKASPWCFGKNIWVSELVRENKWGYYFHTWPYINDEEPAETAIIAFVSYTGEICLAPTVM